MELWSYMEHPTPTSSNRDLTEADLQRVQEALAAALAPNTRSAYLSHWEAFQRWAAIRGLPAAPTDPDTVAAHLAELAEKVRPSTLRVRSCAIKAAHQAAGLADPTAAEKVRRALAGLVRQAAAQGRGGSRQAPGLTATALAAIRATAGQRQVGRSGRRESAAAAAKRGPVDIALCSVMRDAMLRRSEAAALTWGDIETQEDGSGRLAIRVSKSDPEGRGDVQYLGAEAMQDLAAIRPPGSADADPVFGLSAPHIGRRIKRAAAAAGLGDGFSGHSPRVGMTQDLAAAGAELPGLMRAGRWKTSAMPALYARNQDAGHGVVAQYYAMRDPADREPKP